MAAVRDGQSQWRQLSAVHQLGVAQHVLDAVQHRHTHQLIPACLFRLITANATHRYNSDCPTDSLGFMSFIHELATSRIERLATWWPPPEAAAKGERMPEPLVGWLPLGMTLFGWNHFAGDVLYTPLQCQKNSWQNLLCVGERSGWCCQCRACHATSHARSWLLHTIAAAACRGPTPPPREA